MEFLCYFYYVTPEQQLDSVLLFIRKHIEVSGEPNTNYIWSLFVEKTPELGINNKTILIELLQKLVDDGFLNKRVDDNHAFFRVTFKGYCFQGYEEAKRLSESEKDRLMKIQNEQIKLSKGLNLLTVWIVVGTLISALYYIIEIIKNFKCR